MTELPASFRDIEWLILDMDGVLTNEQAYWDTAGLVIRDLLESPAHLGLDPAQFTPIADLFYHRMNRGTRSDWRKYLPPELIVSCKSRGINSNWDLAYLVAGLYLAPLFSPFLTLCQMLTEPPAGPEETGGPVETEADPNADSLPPRAAAADLLECLAPIRQRLQDHVKKEEWNRFIRLRDMHLWGAYFRKQNHQVSPAHNIELRVMDDFHPDIRGLRLLDELNQLMDSKPGRRYSLFGRRTDLWEDCRDLFQQWYLGESLYESVYGRPVPYRPKPGFIHREEPLNGREKTRACLTQLRQAGFRLGIATGRPRLEILTPLQEWDYLHFFEAERIVTHDEVESAEAELKNRGIQELLGKPHPYVFARSIYPREPLDTLLQLCAGPIPDARKVLIVGDAVADIWAARPIGCPTAALLSGAMGISGYRQLEEAKPDVICHDFVELTHALISRKRSP
ncbi:MAG: HAD family hydrolase [bacterium]